MATSVSICSNALLMLGAQPINDLAEDLDRARLAANLYPSVRDDMLRSHPWNCAVKRVVLSPETRTPPYGYAYQFMLPSDWLRTLSVGDYGAEIDYRIEGRAVLANEAALKLRYIFRNENESTWDAMLVHCMTLAMAARMAYAITQSATLEQVRMQELELALKRARAIDGQDEPPETFGDNRLLGSRY
jgi:hypothetical protein